MFNTKRLLIFFLVMLLLVSVMTACFYTNPGMYDEGQDIVDELIEEGMATTKPSPTPTPTPTSDTRTGFYLSEETIQGIREMWQPVNWTPEDFGLLYAINFNYDSVNEATHFDFEYHSDLSADQLKIDFGQKIFQLTPENLYHSGFWIDEKNADEEKLEVTLNVYETPEYTAALIGFIVLGPMMFVEDVYKKWPEDMPLSETLTDENLISKWFVYYPQTQDTVLGKAWHTQPGDTMLALEGLWSLYKDTPGVDDTPEESVIGGPPTPRLRFSYDLYGDGKFIVHGKAMAYEQADVFTVTLGTKIDF